MARGIVDPTPVGVLQLFIFLLGVVCGAAPAAAADPAEMAAHRGFDPAHDLILLQPATPPAIATQPPRAALAAQPTLQVPDALACIGEACIYASLATAFQEVIDHETITILPGTHREAVVLTANNVTIRGEPGAHITGAAAEGKAAIVIRGENTVIEDLECSHIRVADGNGACVRLEGPNLTLRRVHFHDSENGILTGQNSGTVLIEDSLFENNGAAGRAHNLYVGSGTLIIRNSTIVRAQGEGHGIKSRAQKTVIENSIIGSLDGVDSRTLDIPNGGEIIIRNNVLHQGPNTANSNVIGIGLEMPDGQQTYEKNSALIEGNLIISDRERHTLYFQTRNFPEPEIRNNVFVGRTPYEAPDNVWYKSRDAADLPPYPELPQPD